MILSVSKTSLRVPSEDEVRIRKKFAQSNSGADLPITFNVLLNHIKNHDK